MLVEKRAVRGLFAGILGQETPVETPVETVVTPLTLVTPTPTPTPVPEPTPVIEFETPTGLTDWKMMIEQAAMTVLSRHYGRTYSDPPVAVPAAKWGQMLGEMWQEAKRTGTPEAYAEAQRRWSATSGDIYFLTRGFYMQGTYPRIETPGGVWQPAGPEPTPAVVTPAPAEEPPAAVVSPVSPVAAPTRDGAAPATGIWNSIFDRVLYQVTGRSTMLKPGQTIVRAGEGMELTAAQFRQIVAAVQAAVQEVAADPQRPADVVALLQRSATESQISAKLLSRAFYAPGVLPPPVITPPDTEAKYTYEKLWGQVVWIDVGNPQSVATQALKVVIQRFIAQTGVEQVPYAKGYDTMVLPVTWDQGMDLCKAAKALVLEARRAKTISQTSYIRSLSFLRNPRERIEFRFIHPDVTPPVTPPEVTPTVTPTPTPVVEAYSIDEAVLRTLVEKRYPTTRAGSIAIHGFERLIEFAEKVVDPAIREGMTRPDLLTALAAELMGRGYRPYPDEPLTLPYAAPISPPAVLPVTPTPTPVAVTPTPTVVPVVSPPAPVVETPIAAPSPQRAVEAGITAGLRSLSRDALTPTRVGDRVRWYIPATDFDAMVSTAATTARDWYAEQGGQRDAYPLEEWLRLVTIELARRGYLPRAAPTPIPPATPAPISPVPAPAPQYPLTAAHLVHEATENILAKWGLASGYAGPYYLPAPRWRELRADIQWESTRLAKTGKYHQPRQAIVGRLGLRGGAVEAELRKRNILPASPVVVTPPAPTPVAPAMPTLEEWAAEAPIFRDFSECSAAARRATGRTPERYTHCLTEADIRHAAVSQALAAEGMSIGAYRRPVTQEQYNRLLDTAGKLAAAMIAQRTYTPFYLGRRWALLL